MTKLTKYTRECIARSAVAHAYDPKQEALALAEDALAREAHAAIFSESELKAVKKLPANWVRLDSCLRFNVGGLNIALCTQDDGLPVPYRIGDRRGYNCHTLGVIEPGDLCDRIQSHVQQVEDIKAARRKSLYKLEALLNSAPTIKRIREIWPEGEPFYGKYVDRPAVQLPAIRVDELNAELGLAA